mgnify:CR=1 FL=1
MDLILGNSAENERLKKDKKVREEKQMQILHTEHGAMLPEILETSAEKKTGLEPIRIALGVK